MKVYMKKQKQMSPEVIDVSGMTSTQARKLIDKLQARIKDIEDEKYFNDVICKYKEKYNGKWVKLHGSDHYSYDGDTGFRLVKIKDVRNVYHQDDPKKYEFDVVIECLMTFNFPKKYGYVELSVTENRKHSQSLSRITISELKEKPKLVDEIELQEIREKARLALIEKLNLLG